MFASILILTILPLSIKIKLKTVSFYLLRLFLCDFCLFGFVGVNYMTGISLEAFAPEECFPKLIKKDCFIIL